MIEITSEYLASQGLSKTFPQRFWSKVTKTESCWLWTAATVKGYGYIGRGGRTEGNVYAHVASWILHRGPVPHGFDVLHHCDNPPCVNPDHLWVGTHRDNMWDMLVKGRAAVGERHYLHELSYAQIEQIRKMWSMQEMTQQSIADRFGISQGWVSTIVNCKAWKHVNGKYV